MAHLKTNCHMLCFFKTLAPLVVIFCKAIGNAGFSEGIIGNTLMSAKILIRGGASDDSEKKTQIKALSRRRVSIIHPANLKASLSDFPDMRILVPDHPVGKVLIQGIVDHPILVSSICLEPPSESGVPVLMSLKSLLKCVSAGVNDNCLLLGKMNCKTQNARLVILDLKEIKAPVCLTAADIAHIQVKLDLILGGPKLHGGTIMALVHILVNVFHSLDRGN